MVGQGKCRQQQTRGAQGRDGGRTEEGRRKDGGRTEEGRKGRRRPQ